MDKLVNVMETFVDSQLDSVLKKISGFCQCSRCRQDVRAMALNNLPPRYVNTHKGDIYTRLNVLDHAEIARVILEITKAAKVVMANPRHDSSTGTD